MISPGTGCGSCVCATLLVARWLQPSPLLPFGSCTVLPSQGTKLCARPEELERLTRGRAGGRAAAVVTGLVTLPQGSLPPALQTNPGEDFSPPTKALVPT